MNSTQKLLSLGALALILGISACNNDDESGLASKKEAKANIAEFNASGSAQLQELANAEGLAGAKDFFNLTEADDPFGRMATDKRKLKDFLHQKGRSFRSVFESKNTAGRTQNNEPFNYEGHKGVYEWNPQTEMFEKTGASNIIQIKFPTEGSSTNNAELKITKYSDVEVYDPEFNEYWYEPTELNAYLLVDNEEVASLEFVIEWHETGFPLTADIEASVHPFTATLTFDVTSATKSSATSSLRKGDTVLFSASVTVSYSDASKSEESISDVEGHVQFMDLKLQGNIDVEAADASQDGDPNDYVHLSLHYKNRKIGDIVFVNERVDGFEEWVAYIQYADGSKEKLEDVLQPVVDELEALTEGLN